MFAPSVSRPGLLFVRELAVAVSGTFQVTPAAEVLATWKMYSLTIGVTAPVVNAEKPLIV